MFIMLLYTDGIRILIIKKHDSWLLVFVKVAVGSRLCRLGLFAFGPRSHSEATAFAQKFFFLEDELNSFFSTFSSQKPTKF